MRNWSWYLANVTNFLCMGCHMASTILPLHWKDVRFADSQIGWLVAGFSLAAVFTRFGLGYGLERWGRKPVLLFGAAFLTLLSSTYPFLGSSFGLWLAVRMLQGMGVACYVTAVLTWVADRSPVAEIGRLQGVFGVSGLLGSAAGPWLAERIYHAQGAQSMFNALLLVGVICCGLMLLLPESKKGEFQVSGSRQARAIKWKRHRAMLWISVPFGFLVGTIVTFIAPLVNSAGLTKVGLYFTGFAVASVAVRIFAGTLIDRLTINQIVIGSGLALVTSGLALALLAVMPGTMLLLIASLLNGVGHGFLFPALSSHTVRKSSAAQRGGGLALFTGSFEAGIFTGALASGYISQAYGYAWAFVTAAVLLFSSLPFFSPLERGSSRENKSPSR